MSKSLGSREFKFILKPKIFQDLNEGIIKVQKIIDKEVVSSEIGIKNIKINTIIPSFSLRVIL